MNETRKGRRRVPEEKRRVQVSISIPPVLFAFMREEVDSGRAENISALVRTVFSEYQKNHIK